VKIISTSSGAAAVVAGNGWQCRARCTAIHVFIGSFPSAVSEQESARFGDWLYSEHCMCQTIRFQKIHVWNTLYRNLTLKLIYFLNTEHNFLGRDSSFGIATR
jgi:hypothetical protein